MLEHDDEGKPHNGSKRSRKIKSMDEGDIKKLGRGEWGGTRQRCRTTCGNVFGIVRC
jgi:hypothetical protein